MPRPLARLGRLSVVLASLLSWSSLAGAAPKTKYLAIVRPIVELKNVKSGILVEARRMLLDEVGKRPELSLELPADLPTEREPLQAALRERHLRAVEVVLTIVAVSRELRPPAPGKRFRTLVRGIKLTITGTQLPDWMVALTGDGEADVAAEIGDTTDVDKEGHAVLVDAARAAIPQAMDRLVTKLRKGPPPGPTPKKKRH
jgi:hypothetical protein